MTDKQEPKLSAHQGTIYNILSRGGKYSVADLSVYTHFSDPRSHIRNMREKGVPVRDEWRTTATGARYKVYYIPEAQEGR